MTRQNIYFPPCGFGFWYLLGILNTEAFNEYNIYGSSAGSLICLVSILNKKDRDLKTIIDICSSIQEKISINGIFSELNLYNYSSKFCDSIIEIIKQKQNPHIIDAKLDRIYIEVSEIYFVYGFIPYIKSDFIKPKNLNELKNLIICSCYFPILSCYKSLFFYKLNNRYYIDGIFGKLFNKSKVSNIYKINCSRYISIFPCNKIKVINLYNKGLFHKKNLNSNSFFNIFYIIYYNLLDLFNLLLNIIYYRNFI